MGKRRSKTRTSSRTRTSSKSQVQIRIEGAVVGEIPFGKPLQDFSMRWNYILRQRNRWADSESARQSQAERLQADLRAFGVTEAHLQTLAAAGIVEVGIPYAREAEGWEARILPWEYVISAATRKYRSGKTLVVVRHLKRRGRTKMRDPRSMAIVEAAPLPLREHYDFEGERQLIKDALNLPDETIIKDPTKEQLSDRLRDSQPDVVHLMGIDTRLGRELLGESAENFLDGIFLCGAAGGLEEVGAEQLAVRLNAGQKKPLLVGFNLWDSGGRMAPLTVAEGAGAAIGFQHTFDEQAAEVFFVNFYRAYVASRSLLEAFLSARDAIAPYRDRIRGSNITLWSASSLIDSPEYKGFDSLRSEVKGKKESRRVRLQTLRPADPAQDRVEQLVQVTVTPSKYLNYSLLHNGGGILDQFVFRFTSGESAADRGEATAVGSIRNLQVEVRLHVGTDTFPYRTILSLDSQENIFDLANTRTKPILAGNPSGGVRLPLTSELMRLVHERVQTSIFVEVSWHGQILYRQTHPVWLSPIDQWSLTEDDIRWFPSFIQPRDPGVARIIANAQKYLKCLADYGGAGFDGYQSFDPDRQGLEQWQGVDRQVQAIWFALAFDSDLHYINPPPSYAESTQRLRTPGETLSQGRGTCVDLALLVASCLEWVEIYPVVFMLDDHAFPGYWRNLEAYGQFFQVEPEEVPLSNTPTVDEPTPRWISGRSTYREIKAYVDRGDLVPLESVYLTSRTGLQEAIDTGKDHFSTQRNRSFHSLVDIVSSRQEVTPLPLIFPAHSQGRRIFENG